MTISKGQPWERQASPGASPRSARDDADAATIAFEGAGEPPAVLRLESGDLLRTLGYSQPEPQVGLEFSMDLGLVTLDGGKELPFSAHVVAKGLMWSGECLVAMNAAWVQDLYLGPKSHPNDGLLDITHGSLGMGQRVLAARRAKLGTHLPHPALTAKRTPHYEHQFSRPVRVYVDGYPQGRATRISLKLISDAFSVIC
jgi:hypothetical protein